MNNVIPPSHTKRIENCKFRCEGDQCNNALNPLRPHTCNGYCVKSLNEWLTMEYPEMDGPTKLETIIKLTGHESV